MRYRDRALGLARRARSRMAADQAETERGAQQHDGAAENGEEEEVAERLAWARRMVAKAYRRDFAKYPEVLAAFERGESA